MAQERKRKFAEAREKREKIFAKAKKSDGEVKICERFMIGLCYEQQNCAEVHPSQSPEAYSNIPCAIEEPTAERKAKIGACLLYTSPSPRDMRRSRMPSSA